MKILILANNCNWKSWDSKIQELKDWWLPEIALDITLEHTTFTDIPWEDYKSSDGVYKGINQVWFDKNVSLPALKRGFDCVIITLAKKEWKAFPIEGWNTHNNLGIQEISISGSENAKYNFKGTKYEGDQWFNIARHELSHAIYRSRGITDNTHKWWEVGNLEQIKKELELGFMNNAFVQYFKSLLNPPKQYKYFNQNEVEGLNPELVRKVDELRGVCGFPFVITSGLRSEAQNKAVGGVDGSSHLQGLACDIRIQTNEQRMIFVKKAIELGFTRIGIGENFCHVDIDMNKPQNIIWTYYK